MNRKRRISLDNRDTHTQLLYHTTKQNRNQKSSSSSDQIYSSSVCLVSSSSADAVVTSAGGGGGGDERLSSLSCSWSWSWPLSFIDFSWSWFSFFPSRSSSFDGDWEERSRRDFSAGDADRSRDKLKQRRTVKNPNRMVHDFPLRLTNLRWRERLKRTRIEQKNSWRCSLTSSQVPVIDWTMSDVSVYFLSSDVNVSEIEIEIEIENVNDDDVVAMIDVLQVMTNENWKERNTIEDSNPMFFMRSKPWSTGWASFIPSTRSTIIIIIFSRPGWPEMDQFESKRNFTHSLGREEQTRRTRRRSAGWKDLSKCRCVQISRKDDQNRWRWT